MITVGIVGGSGYGAVELIRLLQHHPNVIIKYVFSHSKIDEPISKTFPHLNHIALNYTELNEQATSCDVIFFATPSNVSKHLVPNLINNGVKVIDLSGDFRLTDRNLYQTYYGEAAAEQDFLDSALYSIAEWSEIDSQRTKLIANPGCFPTSILLALHPLIAQNAIDVHSIIIDSKTGVSGAGRALA